MLTQPQHRYQQVHPLMICLLHHHLYTKAPQIPTPINVTNGKIKLQMLPPSVLKGSPNSFSVEDNGLAPSAINFPVDSARCSAFAIGPKSFPIIIIGTANKLNKA